jgi:nucleoside-diphosphate-sugar epimerase
MKILVLGGTGATGRLLVKQLLERGMEVKVIVRSVDRLPENIRNHKNLRIIEANVLEFSTYEMAEIIEDCEAAGVCLGHNLTFKGMYGKPLKLVRDAVKTVCYAAAENKPDETFRFLLMNTTANRNKDLREKRSAGEKIVVGLLRLFLPPQSDNEKAAEYLRNSIGQNHPSIEWVAVRPDGLINTESVADYEVFKSPTRSPIFNAGITSRINVAHFMAELITNPELWDKWKGQMPVIYNSSS